MSARIYTEAVIVCDGPAADGCAQAEFASAEEVNGARELRRVLKRRGWEVGVHPYGAERGVVTDYCPEHRTGR